MKVKRQSKPHSRLILFPIGTLFISPYPSGKTACALGVQAFANANLPEAEYWLAEDGGVADKVNPWGRLPRKDTLERLSESHVLVHPSLHDSGG